MKVSALSISQSRTAKPSSQSRGRECELEIMKTIRKLSLMMSHRPTQQQYIWSDAIDETALHKNILALGAIAIERHAQMRHYDN